MKALQMVGVEQPLELRDVPEPELSPENPWEVVVRVRACGICGTDLHQLHGSAEVSRLPITLGHEVAGTVAEVGAAIREGKQGTLSFQPGDRVVLHNVLFCGNCPACRRGEYNFCHAQKMLGRDVDGGLAEYIKVPSQNLVPLPENIPFPEGAVTGCAGATAFHALRIAHIDVCESVVVWGTGGVGLSLVLLAREISGAHPVIAVGQSEKTLGLADELGADRLVNVNEVKPLIRVKEITNGEGADLVFDTAGITETDADDTVITLGSLRPGGRLVGIATYGQPISLHPHDALGIFEKRFTGSCGNLPDELDRVIRLFSARQRCTLGKLVERTVAPEEAIELIERMKNGWEVARIVVEF